jgi:hypothetical protein
VQLVSRKGAKIIKTAAQPLDLIDPFAWMTFGFEGCALKNLCAFA